MKKTAVLLYPLFSLQEIGTLTELLRSVSYTHLTLPTICSV